MPDDADPLDESPYRPPALPAHRPPMGRAPEPGYPPRGFPPRGFPPPGQEVSPGYLPPGYDMPPGYPPPGYSQPVYGPQPTYGAPSSGVTAKSPGVAVLLTFLWLGAGHLYANRTATGICLLMLQFFVLLPLLFLFGVGILLWLIAAPIAMITAAGAARDFNVRNGIVVR